MSAVSIPCGICPAQIALGMEACPGCGRPLNEQDALVMQVRLEGGQFQAHDRGRQVRAGAKWIGLLAILFAVSAPLNYAIQKMKADEAVTRFDPANDDEAGAADQASVRDRVTRILNRGVVADLVLAGLMGLLWLWARRAPLPAIGCALALFLVVQVIAAIWDPTTIYKGLLVKAISMAALWKGLKAALDARAAMQQRPIA